MSKDLKSKKLLFLLSKGMSIERWHRLGMLSREVDVYSGLAEQFAELWWYSHGENDHRFWGKLNGIHPFKPDSDLLRKAKSLDEYDNTVLDKHPDFFRRFDFVKTNQLSAAPLGLKLKQRFGTRLIIRQGYWYPLQYRILATRQPLKSLLSYYLHEPRLYRQADGIILTSESARNAVIRTYSINGAKVHYLENAINIDIFKPGPGIAASATSILFVGRLSFQKNVTSLVKALRGLPVSLTIIGDGRYKKSVMQLKEKHGLNLRILPRVDNFELPEIYNAHHIFVLPSRWEGNPKTLLEAMACGLPVIGADSYGIRDIIVNGVNGILCKGDANSLREALRSLIADRALREQLSANARRRICEHNDLRVLIEKEADIYSSLLK
jgi:glycosyltransferase involved in cell wall biosynthesis